MKKHIKPSKWTVIDAIVNLVCTLGLIILIGGREGKGMVEVLVLAGLAFELAAPVFREVLRSRYSYPLGGISLLVWSGISFYVLKTGPFHAWFLCLAMVALAFGLAVLFTSLMLICSGNVAALDTLDPDEPLEDTKEAEK